MFRISKEFTFEAAHHLPHLPEGHPCKRVHGHSYKVALVLEAPHLNADGFVIDFRELDVFKSWVDTSLDHRDLNVVLPCKTTSEQIAQFIFGQWRKRFNGAVALVSVRVCETGKTWAEYAP